MGDKVDGNSGATPPKKERDEEPFDEINKYSDTKDFFPEGQEKIQKEIENIKKELDRFKAILIKKYPFIEAIGVIPPQAVKLFIEDDLGSKVSEEEFQKLQRKKHLYIIIRDDKFKDIPKIKKEIILDIIEKEKFDFWIYLKTPLDIWESCFDSKFELVEAIGMSFPLYDKRILMSLRVAQIHKI
ncbi:MAG: hypothetical protein QXU40_04395, partial [Candidatus Pacearchaeota archaeon]